MEHIRVGLTFVALGAAFLLSWLHTRRFVAESVPALGEVVGLSERDGDGVTYAPVIRFPGPGRRPFEFTETMSSNPPGYSVGDRVETLYCLPSWEKSSQKMRSEVRLVTCLGFPPFTGCARRFETPLSV